MRRLLVIIVAVLLICGMNAFATLRGGRELAFIMVSVSPLLILAVELFSRRDERIGPVRVTVVLISSALMAIGALWLLSMLVPPEVFIIGTPALAIVTAWASIRRGGRGREYREIAGLCVNCGYDLRASGERCPECGQIIATELTRRRRIAAKLRAKRGRAAGNPVSHC